MSSDDREALMMEIGTESSAWQEDVQRFDAAAAAKLRVNTTDLRCAYLLMRHPLTAKELAKATGLTPGAVTTVLDRLETAKLARRRHDEKDRRRLLMELTTVGRKRIDEIWGPLVSDGMAMMRTYSSKDLERIRTFLKKVRAIQLEHIARIEGEPPTRR
jgi:DNA-binding MarR family transcriptional regulator